MDGINSQTQDRESGSGFSVVVAEKVLAMAHALKWPEEWDRIGLGYPSKRVTSYTPAQRISAILAGLACGLRGLSSGNTVLRPNSAIAHFRVFPTFCECRRERESIVSSASDAATRARPSR